MRFVSISGDVKRPGVYEVPFGQTGARPRVQHGRRYAADGQRLKAVATSGPSGGFLPVHIKRQLLPEKFVEERWRAGAATATCSTCRWTSTRSAQWAGMLGAAFVVYGDRADMVEQALNCVAFYRNESCGKCVPCRLGSQKLVDAPSELRAGRLRRQELGVIGELSDATGSTSICGLGQVAANPIATVLKFFPEEVEKHLGPP